MNSKTLKFILLLLLGTLFTLSNIYAEGGDKGKNGNTLEKPGTPIRAYMNINFISTLFKNTGISDINAGQDASGLIYPKGSGKTAVYQSGFLWAAQVNDPNEQDPHVGGTVYREGLQSGWINPDGSVVPEDDPGVRIWRVRPDVYPGGPNVDLSAEAQDEVKSEADVRAQYETDWSEWPATIGAPYDDVDGNGSYDPTVDVPGVPGANQTIWFVANDQAASKTQNMYGTLPMGIEQQATIWGYSQTGALGNMIFRRYLIINKTDILGSNRTFDSMYVSMWSDPDVGDSGDDYAGCDTVLSVSFCYNGKGQDAIYGGTVPALGFDFFQGPLVEGVAGQDKNKNGVDDASDYGIFKNQEVGPGLINLPMTAAYYYINTDPTLTDPVQGSYAEGAVRWYRFMKGRIGLTNEPFVDPNTGQQTPFTLPGDPVTGEGWIDGQQFAYADRRIGMASGPFTMAPGDTQEVVVAEILAGAIEGVDRLSAVALMKFYDQIAQVAYDNFFDLPVPPPSPDVTVAALDQQIVLDWGSNQERVALTENSDSKGYLFQGYNVYQLPTQSSSPSEGVRVATYDIIDGVGKIYDLTFDPNTGSVVDLPVQFGNDVGVKRFISITQDAINQTTLVNGVRYYFAVTAYNYNSEFGIVPNNLENPLRIFTIIPQSPNPGVTYGQGTGGEIEFTHNGTADGGPDVTIIDPSATTGHEYTAFFTEVPEIRDPDGNWIPAGTVRRGGNGPDTLTGSSVNASAVFGSQTGTLQLNFMLDLVSPDFNWADGITLKFYSGVTILDAPSFEAGGGTVTPEVISYAPDSIIVNLGDVSGSLSEYGIFHGDEEWSFTVQADVPLTFDYQIYDDGYSGGPVDAFGVTTVTAVGNLARIAKYWNLEDMETAQVVLKDQSVVNGIDLYPDRDDQLTDYGLDASPIVDGVQINMSIGYAAPVTISQNNEPTLNGDEVFGFSGSNVWWTDDSTNYRVCDFQRFGYSPATVLGTLGPSTGGYTDQDVGTTDVNQLQQDLEFRWTGVLADTVINDSTLTITSSGGSMITLFGASGYDIADHPLNPNPGSDDPFILRVPFEIWNIDTGEQINSIYWDRSGDPTVDSASVWVQDNRQYLWLVNSPYAEAVIDPTGAEINEFGTWNIVWYISEFTLGDVIGIFYDNPIQIGSDTYSFTTTAPTYSSSLAQDQVGDINVFPNPYYGFSTEELNKYNRFVTFNHLPPQANFRIFNLAGVLVSSFEKSDEGQFAYWDLNNDYGLPVASGLYIVYIDMPELGTTKILKVAIIQEQQVLDRF